MVKKMNLWDILIKLLIVCIPLENFKLFSIFGAPIKISHLILFMMIIISIKKSKINKKQLAFMLIALVMPLIPIYRINDLLEFFKSYIMYFLFVIFLFFSLKNVMNEFKKNFKIYVNLILNVILIIEVLGLLQFLVMKVFDYTMFINFFGKFSACSTIVRHGAFSLFHEPSVLGWVINFEICLLFYIENKNILSKHKLMFYLILSIFCLASTLSASAFIILIILLITRFLLSNISKRNKISTMLIFIIPCLMLYYFTDLLSPLHRISTELTTKNTSGYERIISPLLYLKKVFENFPIFGRGFGQEGNVDVIGKIGLYTKVNNSIIGIFIDFGLSCLFFLIPLFKKVKEFYLIDKRFIFIIISMFSIYISTGAYLAVDTFIFLIFTLCIIYNFNSKKFYHENN